jgi:hypothetical protein
MFDQFLHNHTRTVVDGEGRQVTVKATCAEVNTLIGSHAHITDVLVPDGNGGEKMAPKVISCIDAEVDRMALQRYAEAQTLEIGDLNAKVATLTTERDNCNRLMSGAIQVIFGMGPALQGLLSDDLGAPDLTSDRSAVKLEGAVYTVVIDVFRECIIVRAVTGDVPEKVFRVYNGHLDADSRTLLLGHVTRIKAVAAGSTDPVRESINLVDQMATAA